MRGAYNEKDRLAVMLAPGYEWSTRDYIQAPLAFIIGALHALPQDTKGPECSSNATALRAKLLEGFDYGDSEENEKEAAYAYYKAGSYLDEVGV